MILPLMLFYMSTNDFFEYSRPLFMLYPHIKSCENDPDFKKGLRLEQSFKESEEKLK